MNYPIFNYYKESVAIMNKGLEVHMERTVTRFPPVLTSLRTNSMGKFLKRQGISNSSHNNFLGEIPSSMMNLTEVESLDLSKDQLSAEIPGLGASRLTL
jgi:hypothetical protein